MASSNPRSLISPVISRVRHRESEKIQLYVILVLQIVLGQTNPPPKPLRRRDWCIRVTSQIKKKHPGISYKCHIQIGLDPPRVFTSNFKNHPHEPQKKKRPYFPWVILVGWIGILMSWFIKIPIELDSILPPIYPKQLGALFSLLTMSSLHNLPLLVGCNAMAYKVVGRSLRSS